MINQYVILKKLGQGQYGEVKLCYDKEKKLKFAMKVVDFGKMAAKFVPVDKTQQTLLTEIAILKKLKHKNVIQIQEVIED